MRILITGGAGFLGSHLCDKLIAQGHEIVCLDNLFTGSKANIAHLLGNPSFEFVRHDVIDPFKYEVDQIYNLACPAEVYGDPLVHPQPEELLGQRQPGRPPRGVYDEAKRFAEAMTMAYQRPPRCRRASSASSTPTARACG
jgi:UDP-glucuronate decarboxylase